MSKPKETPYHRIDAGFGAAPSSDWERAGLPFDPRDFAVESKALAARLADVTDPVTIGRLQSFDTRTTAAAEYERRINALAAEE